MKPVAVGAGEAVQVSHLTREFQLGIRGVRLRAVDDVSLTVREGEVFGLLGPNGSGKSTTLKVLLGLLPPTRGSCHLFGRSCDEVGARSEVGYLPEAPNFHRLLAGRELVAYYGGLCGLRGARLRERTDEVLGLVGLAAAADRRVGTYSKGMLQRVGLAQALVHDPRLLILDEPTAGLDPLGTAEFARLILKLKERGKTVLLCSHLLAQVEGLCDRVAILDRGRVVAEGTVEELVGGVGDAGPAVEGLAPEQEDDLRAWLERRGARLVRREGGRRSLDAVFLERLGDKRGDDRA